MLMSVIGRNPSASYYGELAGIRTLITGLSPSCGVDLARAFADHRGRLILHTSATSPESDALAAILSETASGVEMFTGACKDANSSVRFAQKAAQVYGGLDVVVNLVPITAAELRGHNDLDSVEDLVSRKLKTPLLVSRVAANRMRLTLTEGLILNVMTTPAPRSAGEVALAGVARTALAAITRGEAETWSSHGIRVNAIGPRTSMLEEGACLASEPDIAALALYLASKRGRELTGQIFDAAGVAARRC
jgi:NAD(P)-dependent dehydrogenase (short-subunit alcohol dehydrogenase family)